MPNQPERTWETCGHLHHPSPSLRASQLLVPLGCLVKLHAGSELWFEWVWFDHRVLRILSMVICPRGWEGMCRGLSAGLLLRFHCSPAEVARVRESHRGAAWAPALFFAESCCSVSLVLQFTIWLFCLSSVGPLWSPFIEESCFLVLFAYFFLECSALTLILHLRHVAQPAPCFSAGAACQALDPQLTSGVGRVSPIQWGHASHVTFVVCCPLNMRNSYHKKCTILQISTRSISLLPDSFS